MTTGPQAGEIAGPPAGSPFHGKPAPSAGLLDQADRVLDANQAFRTPLVTAFIDTIMDVDAHAYKQANTVLEKVGVGAKMAGETAVALAISGRRIYRLVRVGSRFSGRLLAEYSDERLKNPEPIILGRPRLKHDAERYAGALVDYYGHGPAKSKK